MNDKNQLIYTTRDYSIFKKLPGNREPYSVNKRNKLKAQLIAKGQIQPAILNEHMQVIDGQHRIEILSELNKPVTYIIIKGANLESARDLNNNSHSWSSHDYAGSFVEEGHNDYRIFESFKKRYPYLHDTTCIMLLSNENWQNGDMSQKFRTGGFKVRSYVRAEETAKLLMAVHPFFKGINKKAFISALIKLMKVEKFDQSRFLFRLEKHSHVLREYARTADFLEALEEIYNYRVHKDSKIRIPRKAEKTV